MHQSQPINLIAAARELLAEQRALRQLARDGGALSTTAEFAQHQAAQARQCIAAMAQAAAVTGVAA